MYAIINLIYFNSSITNFVVFLLIIYLKTSLIPFINLLNDLNKFLKSLMYPNFKYDLILVIIYFLVLSFM